MDNIAVENFLNAEQINEFRNLKWMHKYNPLTHSFRSAKAPEFSQEMVKTVSKLVGKTLKLLKAEALAFLPGDYTVLADDTKPAKGYMAIIDINSVPEEAGVYTSFLNENAEVVRIVPQKNTLFVVNQNGLKSFVKYHNHKSNIPRIFLYCELEKDKKSI